LTIRTVVFEKTKKLSIRAIDVRENLGPGDVVVAIKNVGMCGNNLSYYQHGAIGQFVV
jgi:D-xylulose reductase